MDLARDNYWQRCYKCWALVDLVDGCDQIAYVHICGSVYCNQTLILQELDVSVELIFCYRCGKKWKVSKQQFCEPESSQLFALPKTRSWTLSRLFTRIFRLNKFGIWNLEFWSG